MHTLLHGVPWAHLVPALLAVVFAFFYLKAKHFYLKVIFGLLWLLFIPNTTYIFIDIKRIALHWNSLSILMRFVLIVQYIILELIGLVTFLLSMIPFENFIHSIQISRKKQITAIILFMFIIGFGMMLGRSGYTNPYIIFTQPIKVFLASINIVMSLNLIELVILFGIVCNGIYFVFRNKLIRYSRKLL